MSILFPNCDSINFNINKYDKFRNALSPVNPSLFPNKSKQLSN